jgi:hypothetical protein
MNMAAPPSPSTDAMLLPEKICGLDVVGVVFNVTGVSTSGRRGSGGVEKVVKESDFTAESGMTAKVSEFESVTDGADVV